MNQRGNTKTNNSATYMVSVVGKDGANDIPNTCETNNTLTDLFKHYGNIRFVMLPIFFTVIGAIAVAYWNVSSVVMPNKYLQICIVIAGIIYSSIFCFYEYSLSNLLQKISNELPDSLQCVKHDPKKKKVTHATALIYFVPGVILLVLFVSHLVGNINPAVYKLSSKCSTFDKQQTGELSSWNVVVKLNNGSDIVSNLYQFSSRNIGKNVKFVDGNNKTINIIKITEAIPDSFVILSNKRELEASEVVSRLSLSKHGCGEVL